MMDKVTEVEIFDVGVVAFALLGAGIEYEMRANPDAGSLNWLGVHADVGFDPKRPLARPDLEFVKELVSRAVGCGNSTPGLEVKIMAGCCGLGQLLNEGVEVCPACGAHREAKKTGEPPWRVPVKAETSEEDPRDLDAAIDYMTRRGMGQESDTAGDRDVRIANWLKELKKHEAEVDEVDLLRTIYGVIPSLGLVLRDFCPKLDDGEAERTHSPAFLGLKRVRMWLRDFEEERARIRGGR